MRRLAMMVVIFALAAPVAGMLCVRATTAEPGAAGVYEACVPSEERVKAADLPRWWTSTGARWPAG